jgi:DNA-binding transcriptional MerR regulator
MTAVPERSISISQAARRLHIATSTLRSWERRYGYPTPARTPGGHRRYRLDEVQQLVAALASTAAEPGYPRTAIDRLKLQSPPASGTEVVLDRRSPVATNLRN